MRSDLLSALRPALVLTLLFAALLGILYPLALTGVGQLLFPSQANGSLVRDASGRAVGSDLIGQRFASPRYFTGRPSAAGEGYDPLASAGSNLGPTAQVLADRVREATSVDPGAPADLLYASGSGLDPHVTPAAALHQVSRVAAARGLPVESLRALVRSHVETPLLGVLGEPRVNVLRLNRALDDNAARP